MSLSLTLFKTIFDNKTHKRMDFVDWESFAHTLFELSDIPVNSKKDAQLISPAIYKPDTTRKNDSVVGWAGWCAVDVDDYVVKGELNRSSELYSDLDHMLKQVRSERSGTHSIRNYDQLVINNVKTSRECITSLRRIITLLTLFSVIMVLVLMLMHLPASILTVV